MSSTNNGNQILTWDYKHPRNAKNFNKLLKDVIEKGIYNGGTISKVDDSTIEINPFSALLLANDTSLTKITTSETVELSVSPSEDLVYGSFTWNDTENNFLDFDVKSSSGTIESNEIVFGKVNFSSGNVDSFDYDNTTYGKFTSVINSITAKDNIQGSQLISDISSGTAPLIVSSTTRVDNLNIEYLDGNSESDIKIQGEDLATDTTLTKNKNYFLKGTDQLVLTLPATMVQGDFVNIVDVSGFGYKIKPNSGQIITSAQETTIEGLNDSAYITNIRPFSNIKLICSTANTTWEIFKRTDLISYNKGYCMGGHTGAFTVAIDDLNFSDESSNVITATLDTARTVQAGASSNLKGYNIGGNAGGVSSAVIEDLNFSNETSNVITATLDTAKKYNVGVNSNIKGYCMGGNTGSAIAVIEDLNFSDESSNVISATLDTAKYSGAGVSSNLKGYYMGGTTGTVSAVIEDLNFSEETSNVIVATLDTAKEAGTGVNSRLKGYCMGGYTPSPVTVIEDLNFSDESSNVITATLDTAKRGGTGVSSNLKGYMMGGYDVGVTAVIEDLNFSDESSTVITATLDTATLDSAGVSPYT